ncbi:SDR family NAD(P)-dependent oxidoreductase [Nonomuraea endophytica]|uniref:NAD(P)-dependent dehydrogenase (Short-subunit alcohol dehydrogenase family) n=1 Tax=Nonomuraea endophytica TaxID=714136 RepID=A0A7W8AB27_9ACTN|nr:SDR family NAD(P)-dependent oxidoreductase [Nonomuraea endophytica]MBB5081906.1 NAD(P)-dependent dehydrogenase (short-subunit alcohol dehydrogenase family) [Nonomuraea endophytica]
MRPEQPQRLPALVLTRHRVVHRQPARHRRREGEHGQVDAAEPGVVALVCRLVNVSSHAGSPTLTGDPDRPFAALLPSAAYTPSKAALSALTVQCANELRKEHILVNAVAPG